MASASNDGSNNNDEEGKKPGFFRRLFTSSTKKKNDDEKKKSGIVGFLRKVFTGKKQKELPQQIAEPKTPPMVVEAAPVVEVAQSSKVVKPKKNSKPKVDSRSEKVAKRSKKNSSSSSSSASGNESTAKETKVKKKSKKKKSSTPANDDASSDSRTRSPLDSIKSGLSSFKKNRAKDFKKMTTFVSRPFRQKALSKMLVRLNQRKERKRLTEESTQSSEKKKQKFTCEDSFPQQSPSNSQSNSAKGTDEKPNVRTAQTMAKVEREEQSQRESTPAKEPVKEEEAVFVSDVGEDDDWRKKYPPVLENKTNNGKLLMSDGRPFWHRMKKNAKGEFEEDEDSDDELPMNADVLNDVYEGKIVLAEMPKIPIRLDPYGPLEELKEQALQFCTRNILMGNTVRTMVNMCDEDSHKKEHVRVDKRKVPTFVEPKQVILYDRAQPTVRTKTVELTALRNEVKVEAEVG